MLLLLEFGATLRGAQVLRMGLKGCSCWCLGAPCSTGDQAQVGSSYSLYLHRCPTSSSTPLGPTEGVEQLNISLVAGEVQGNKVLGMHLALLGIAEYQWFLCQFFCPR